MNRILERYEPLYLNSLGYFSKDWRIKSECKVFSNRKLLKDEIVADFDKLKDVWLDLKQIIKFFESKSFKFWVYQSGTHGLHVHFFVNKVHTKHQKAALLEILSKQSGYDIDKGPVKRGWIRAEGSLHPTKGFKKTLLYANIHAGAYICRDFYMNYIFGQESNKVFNSGFSGAHNPKPDIGSPLSIEVMLDNKFNDGVKRVLFCLVSFWKSKKIDDDKIFNKAKSWLDFQKSNVLESHIWATIKSSSGLVREGYRVKLLNELGLEDKLKPKNQVESSGF